MAWVLVRLSTVLPRWLLAVDPWVSVNGGAAHRLTQTPVVLEVPAGPVHVEVTLFAPGTDDSWGGRPSEYKVLLAEEDVLRLHFHPSWLNSWRFSGSLRRE